jgi:hypothetical protein
MGRAPSPQGACIGVDNTYHLIVGSSRNERGAAMVQGIAEAALLFGPAAR